MRVERQIAAPDPLLRPALAYPLAVILVAVCAFLRWLLDPILEGQGVYLAFMIPVAVSAYLAGTGPGALSIVLSATAASPLFRPPYSPERTALAHLALFLFESVAVLELFRRLQRNETAIRRALAEAEEARQRADDASAAKEQFVARVSHEWRSPLNAVTGWLWQIERRPDDSALVQRAAASMRRAVDTQIRLVSDLLDYSRGSLGKLAITPESRAPIDLVRRAIDVVSPDATRKRIAIELEDHTNELRIWADPMRLEQVFVNLLQNAVKFTLPDGRIWVVLIQTGDALDVSVNDDGVGIPPEKLATIFDAFAQSNERRDTLQGGLGLGLSIVRQLVQLHGGRVRATSSGPGCGSSFYISLPIASTEHADLTTPASTAQAQTGGPSLPDTRAHQVSAANRVP